MLAERPHIETITALCPAAARRPSPPGRRCAQVVTAIDSREAISGTARTARRQRGRLHDRAAARRRHAGDVPRRHRLGQCRARAARAQRSARGRRQDQDRFRPSRVLRAALAAHQHHRLRPSARRSGDRSAGRQAARISRLHHRVDRIRCSRSSTTSSISPPSTPAACTSISARSTSATPWMRPPKACRTGWSAPASCSTSAPPPTSAASSPTSGACGRSCSTFSPTR